MGKFKKLLFYTETYTEMMYMVNSQVLYDGCLDFGISNK